MPRLVVAILIGVGTLFCADVQLILNDQTHPLLSASGRRLRRLLRRRRMQPHSDQSSIQTQLKVRHQKSVPQQPVSHLSQIIEKKKRRVLKDSEDIPQRKRAGTFPKGLRNVPTTDLAGRALAGKALFTLGKKQRIRHDYFGTYSTKDSSPMQKLMQRDLEGCRKQAALLLLHELRQLMGIEDEDSESAVSSCYSHVDTPMSPGVNRKISSSTVVDVSNSADKHVGRNANRIEEKLSKNVEGNTDEYNFLSPMADRRRLRGSFTGSSTASQRRATQSMIIPGGVSVSKFDANDIEAEPFSPVTTRAMTDFEAAKLEAIVARETSLTVQDLRAAGLEILWSMESGEVNELPFRVRVNVPKAVVENDLDDNRKNHSKCCSSVVSDVCKRLGQLMPNSKNWSSSSGNHCQQSADESAELSPPPIREFLFRIVFSKKMATGQDYGGEEVCKNENAELQLKLNYHGSSSSVRDSHIVIDFSDTSEKSEWQTLILFDGVHVLKSPNDMVATVVEGAAKQFMAFIGKGEVGDFSGGGSCPTRHCQSCATQAQGCCQKLRNVLSAAYRGGAESTGSHVVTGSSGLAASRLPSLGNRFEKFNEKMD